MKKLLLLLCLVSRSASAGEGDADTREQCRAAVSGAYLGFMNDLDLLKGNLQASNETTFALRARKIGAVKELKTLEDRNEAAKTPAAELDEELVGMRDTIEHTTDAILESDARMATIKDQIAVKEKAFKEFHKDMKAVFEVAHAKIVNQGAYPIKLQYRHACEKFLQLCPLPKDQADALIKLSRSLQDATPCERYAQMGRAKG